MRMFECCLTFDAPHVASACGTAMLGMLPAAAGPVAIRIGLGMRQPGPIGGSVPVGLFYRQANAAASTH